MSEKKDKSPVEGFGEMMEKFGEAVSKIFDDPELKKKAKEFGESASISAKAFGSRFKDEKVKEKFRDLGKSAQDFGKSVADYFKEGKREESGKEESGREKSGEGENSKEEPGSEDPEEEKPGVRKPGGNGDWGENVERKMEEFGEKAGKAGKEFGKKMEEAGKKAERYFNDSKGGRVVGYSMAIVWSAFLLVFFNFYHRYIAYYSYSDGIWNRATFLTEDFERWLPVVTAALVASIIGNILLIIYDRYWFKHLIQIIMDIFGLASVASLLSIFPFDFTVFPGDLTGILTPIVMAVLILIIIGLSIGIIVRFVRLIMRFIGSAD